MTEKTLASHPISDDEKEGSVTIALEKESCSNNEKRNDKKLSLQFGFEFIFQGKHLAFGCFANKTTGDFVKAVKWE